MITVNIPFYPERREELLALCHFSASSAIDLSCVDLPKPLQSEL
jgi:hypothetical protein